MALIKFNNGYGEMPDAKLLSIAEYVEAQMTGNANFTTPDPSLSEFHTSIKTFADAVTAAMTGDRMKIALKKEAKEALVDAMHLMGAYVAYASKGSLTIAQSSGLPLAKYPAPAPPLTPPQNLQAVNSNQSGTVKVSVKAVPGAMSYMHQYTTDADLKEESWKSMNCSQCKCNISGLTPAVVYYFRVVAIGRKDQVMYSDVVTRLVA